jgi:hypothetical protein
VHLVDGELGRRVRVGEKLTMHDRADDYEADLDAVWAVRPTGAGHGAAAPEDNGLRWRVGGHGGKP